MSSSTEESNHTNKRQKISDLSSIGKDDEFVALSDDSGNSKSTTGQNTQRPSHLHRKPPQRLKSSTVLYSNPNPELVNRSNLDFDIEQICSVTLQTVNVYACLTCGVFLQGIQAQSPAYLHSLKTDHFLFLHLGEGTFWYLPDGYEIIDPSLDDIYENLFPSLVYRTDVDPTEMGFAVNADTQHDTRDGQSQPTPTNIPSLPFPPFPTPNHYIYRALDGEGGPNGNRYIPSLKAMNNIGRTEWLSCSILLLCQVHPLRDYLLGLEIRSPQAITRYTQRSQKLQAHRGQSSTQTSIYPHGRTLRPVLNHNSLILSLASTFKHLSHYASFRAHVSPFDLLNTVSSLSNYRFQSIKQQQLETRQLTQRQLETGGSGPSALTTQQRLSQQQQMNQNQPQQFLLWLLNHLHDGLADLAKKEAESDINSKENPQPQPQPQPQQHKELSPQSIASAPTLPPSPSPSKPQTRPTRKHTTREVLHTGKSKKSLISDLFQGVVKITTKTPPTAIPANGDSMLDDAEKDHAAVTSRSVPFFCLTLAPAQSIFYDPDTGNTDKNTAVSMHNQRNSNKHRIDSLSSLLGRYNGEFKPTTGSTGKHLLQSMRLTRLPHYLLINVNRFFKNDFLVETDPTLIEIDPSGTIDLSPFYDQPSSSTPDHGQPPGSSMSTQYELVANIVHITDTHSTHIGSGSAVHQSSPNGGESSYKIYVYHDLSSKWYCCRDLSVSTSPNTFKEALLSRSVALLFRRRTS